MRPRASLRAALIPGIVLLAAMAAAQGVPPWVPAGHPPLPEDVVSAEITRPDEPLYVGPDTHAARRGAAGLGVRLPIFGASRGAGCRDEFFLVGPGAWVCGDGVRVTSEAASAPDSAPPPTADGLPRSYFFVGKDGTLGYRDLASAEETAPSGELQSGFAVSMTRLERGPTGESYGLTTKGLWLPLRDLNRVVPLGFSGYAVTEGRLDRGFVVTEQPATYREPGKKGPTPDPKPAHFSIVPMLETRHVGTRSYVRVAEATWLDRSDVRTPMLAAPPAEARAGERWIDVDLAEETLVAYEGTRPVYATLVSTGLGKGDEETATPVGVHRIWVKLRTTDMTNLEDPEAAHYYAMEEVPWVMFFKKGFGIHGAFWHRAFGHPRSHGCVNLTPLDARFLFDWAGPRLPTGWTAVLPTDWDPGTLVRVR